MDDKQKLTQLIKEHYAKGIKELGVPDDMWQRVEKQLDCEKTPNQGTVRPANLLATIGRRIASFGQGILSRSARPILIAGLSGAVAVGIGALLLTNIELAVFQPTSVVTDAAPIPAPLPPTADTAPIPAPLPPTADATPIPAPLPTTAAALITYKSDLPRDTDPQAGAEDKATLAAGNGEFALRLFQTLRAEKPNDNIFFSPYSISTALSQLYAGLDGGLADSVADALNFELPRDRLYSAFNRLDLTLAEHEGGGNFALNTANGLWTQDGFPIHTAYLDRLATNYGSQLYGLDFERDSEAARKVINAWVEQKTNDRIKELFPPGSITGDTKLVLANAIYFYADWLDEFEEIGNAPFTTLDGTALEVPSMVVTKSRFRYQFGDGYTALELPYTTAGLSMLILLPDAGGYAAFESSLDHAKLNGIVASLEDSYGDSFVRMPKFEFTKNYDLVGTLKNLGVSPVLFSKANPCANGYLERMFVYGDFCWVQAIVHKAFIKVDEQDTEAAATDLSLGIFYSVAPGPTIILIDRPFVFAIRDTASDHILFLGSVLDPR